MAYALPAVLLAVGVAGLLAPTAATATTTGRSRVHPPGGNPVRRPARRR
jgi:hypothetical protein